MYLCNTCILCNTSGTEKKISIKGSYYLGSAVTFTLHKLHSYFCPNQAKRVLKSEVAVICMFLLYILKEFV